MPTPSQRPRKSSNPFHGSRSIFKSGKRVLDVVERARDSVPGSVAANDRYEKGGGR